MDSFEQEIIIGLQQNNIKAFDRLFNTYYSPLCFYAYDLVRKPEVAREIVHDLFIKIWNTRDAIVVHTTLRGYLYRSVHNQCLNYLRNIKIEKGIDTVSIDDENNRIQFLNISTPPEIIEKLFSTQLESYLEKAMNSLPEQCRQIFYLSRFENLSYPEIASKLNLALSTVKTQMLRAISKLKDELKGKI